MRLLCDVDGGRYTRQAVFDEVLVAGRNFNGPALVAPIPMGDHVFGGRVTELSDFSLAGPHVRKIEKVICAGPLLAD